MSDELELEDELLVPSPEERGWVLARLADLVRRRGHEHFVLAPLLEPTETYFPDPWGGGAASLERVVRRLLIYADLDEADVDVKIYADDEVGGPLVPAGIGSPAWFVRNHEKTVHVAARETAMKDPMLLVPALARVVAEAWRSWYGITTSDPVVEQRLTDITSVYLGFGLLTTDASVRHSSERAGGFRLNRKKTRLGVLPTQVFAFALATQLHARGLTPKQRKKLTAKLQSNQAGFVAASVALFEHDVEFITTLKLPPSEQWGEPPPLSVLTAPMSSAFMKRDEVAESKPEERLDLDRGVRGMNEGKPVFRVERSKALRLAKMLALPIVLLGVLAGRMNMGIEIEMWKVASIAAVLGLAGLGVGRLIPDSRCSEPKCGEPLKADAETCPRCGGQIAGVIGHPKERLAAEEKLERERAG